MNSAVTDCLVCSGAMDMGTVYEAEQLDTDRRVALKMLAHQLDSPDMRQRFLREGRLAASVNHPNSLTIFGSEEIESLPVIVMEIAGGGTLKDKLKTRSASRNGGGRCNPRCHLRPRSGFCSRCAPSRHQAI